MKPCKQRSVDTGSHGPLSQWVGRWWSTMLQARGWPEWWEHCVTWGPPWPFPTGGWRLQNRHILIPQQGFLLCLAFSAMRWDRGLQIPLERRNIEFQNIEKLTNSMKRVYVFYVLSKHNGYWTTSFLHSAYAHAV